MTRPIKQFSLKTMLVASFGIALLLGLVVGWSQAHSNPVYLAAVCLSCFALGAVSTMILMPPED